MVWCEQIPLEYREGEKDMKTIQKFFKILVVYLIGESIVTGKGDGNMNIILN